MDLITNFDMQFKVTLEISLIFHLWNMILLQRPSKTDLWLWRKCTLTQFIASNCFKFNNTKKEWRFYFGSNKNGYWWCQQTRWWWTFCFCSEVKCGWSFVNFSDANLQRYGISSTKLANILTSNKKVKAFAIFIASLGDEAER